MICNLLTISFKMPLCFSLNAVLSDVLYQLFQICQIHSIPISSTPATSRLMTMLSKLQIGGLPVQDTR